MKKIMVAALAAIVVTGGLYSCKKVIKKIFNGLDADVPEIVVKVPFASLPAGTPVPPFEIEFPSFTQHFDLDSSIKAKTNGEFGAADVSSIKVKQIIFTINNGDSLNNFSNFESARITFSSNTDTAQAPIMSLFFPDKYAVADTFIAPANTPELVNYLKGNELTYKVYGKLRRYTTKEVKLAVAIKLRVR